MKCFFNYQFLVIKTKIISHVFPVWWVFSTRAQTDSRARVRILIKYVLPFSPSTKAFCERNPFFVLACLPWSSIPKSKFSYNSATDEGKEHLSPRQPIKTSLIFDGEAINIMTLILRKPPCSCYIGDWFHGSLENVMSASE